MISYAVLKSIGSSGANEDIGLVLILATPVLLLIAFIIFIVAVASKNKKTRLFKIAAITFVTAGVSALVGLGQCGWFS